MELRASSFIKTILVAGLIAGTLDIIAACVKYYFDTGNGPEGVLRFVASGYFGSAAFTSSSDMALWGLFYHFLIAFGWAALFGLLTKILPGILSRPMLTGFLFGIGVWAAMNFLILPLTLAPKLSVQPIQAAVNAFIIVACVGWPIAGIFSSWHRKTARF